PLPVCLACRDLCGGGAMSALCAPLTLHDALPFSGFEAPTIGAEMAGLARTHASATCARGAPRCAASAATASPPLRSAAAVRSYRSEEHTSELQSRENLVCRMLLEKKKC